MRILHQKFLSLLQILYQNEEITMEEKNEIVMVSMKEMDCYPAETIDLLKKKCRHSDFMDEIRAFEREGAIVWKIG